MKFRSLILSVLAIGCGLSASILTARYLNSSPVESHVSVLVARNGVPPGASLRDYESLFVPREFPSTAPLPMRGEADIQERCAPLPPRPIVA